MTPEVRRFLIHVGALPPPEIEEFLSHYGVKGMKWGVRNDDDSSGDGKLADWQKKPNDKLTPKERARNVADAKRKFVEKAGPLNKEERRYFGLTGKQAAGVAAGVGLAGVAAYGAYKLKTSGVKPGGLISPEVFKERVRESQSRIWGHNNKVTDDLLKLPGFEIPAGHVFHRVTGDVQSKFLPATYTTASIEDFNRYVYGLRTERGRGFKPHHTTFTSDRPVKIASVSDALQAMRDSWKFQNPNLPDISDLEVQNLYSSLSGTPWRGPLSEGVISRLRERGFDGVIDAMDFGVIGERPLVLFNNESLSAPVSRALSEREVSRAIGSLTELANRR